MFNLTLIIIFYKELNKVNNIILSAQNIFNVKNLSIFKESPLLKIL